MSLIESVPFRKGALIALAMLAAAGVARGQVAAKDTIPGADTFRTYCAACHGSGAKGDGPLAEHLRFKPPDLTLLAKRSGGTYPDDTVFRIIDGRKPMRGHGGPDMPVWGDAFKNVDTGFSEENAKARIQGLVDYLKSIQAPAK